MVLPCPGFCFYNIMCLRVCRMKIEVYELEQMRIMICDDNERDREEIRRCAELVWPEAEIAQAGSARAVLEQIRKGLACDLIFLDIYLEEQEGTAEGILAGRWLRENFPEISLVFISNSREFGPELFELNALHYLVKPCSLRAMREVRRRYEERHSREAVVEIPSGAGEQSIPFQRIAYIESEHNNLQIHLLNGSVLTVRDSVQNYMEKLDDRFLRINRGVIVNMEALDRMTADSCEIGGKIFLLSRKSRAESRRRYNDYMFRAAMNLQ